MKRESKILFCAQDPGGYNSILPVYRRIKNKYQSELLLAGASVQLAEKLDVDFVDCSEKSDRSIAEILDSFQPDIVFAATSDGMCLEKKITAWAKENGVKTVSIVDYWGNYKLRYSSPGTEDLKYLTDLICVADEKTKNDMIEVGFDNEIIHITGNPFFEKYKDVKSADEGFILFVSQPFSEIYENYHFNEIEIFRDYVKVIKKLEINLPIIVALHPRCKNRDKFNDIIKDLKLDISIAGDIIENIIPKTKIVLGINSMALFEAALSGKKVISYQPGVSKENDQLISNELGATIPVYNLNNLEHKVKEHISSGQIDNERLRQKYVFSNATEKVINVIYSELN